MRAITIDGALTEASASERLAELPGSHVKRRAIHLRANQSSVAYIMSIIGLLDSADEIIAPCRDDIAFLVPIFNPASDINQRSYLWITNLSRQRNTFSVYGTDDAGVAGLGPVRFAVGAGTSVRLDSQDFEDGIPDINSGRFGDGTGKWRLVVEAEHAARCSR